MELLKLISAAGDVSTVLIVVYIYISGQKIRGFVHEELKPIRNAITRLETILEIKTKDF